MMKQIWFLGIAASWAPSPSQLLMVHADELHLDSTCENSYSPNGLDRGILSWMHNLPGGFYNPKLEFRHSDPNDPTSLAGIFAKERLEEGDLLCRVPWEYIISSPLDEIEGEQLECPMLRVLSQELQLGKFSKFGPYVEYLNTQPMHQLPSVWSPEAQDLLLQVMGQTREQNHIYDFVLDRDLDAFSFPPLRMVGWMDEWHDRCNGNDNDTWGKRAALMALLRADDYMMIPAYDFFNHRNGEWHNADTKTEFGIHHETRARRVIEEGEQIYISYYRCHDCRGRSEGYGTPDMLRDYGFIEPFPQHWYFHHYNAKELKEAKEVSARHMEFDLDQKDGYYSVEWMYEPQDKQVEKSLEWLRKQIMRLTRLRYKESNNTLGIPQHEWDMTWAFHQANVVAMKAAMRALEGQNLSIAGATTTSVNDLYHDLAEDRSWYAADAEFPACDMPEYELYKKIDGALSFKRAIEIFEQGDDVCLDQNEKAHVCSSFRPGYYEYIVHPAMSYLEKIERVLIIANGASFFLHEILKYDITSALVVETDQTMTHMAQKHFNVDPHLHDPRIEWWFSDPVEVLPLVDNWGSFDLVVIDVPDSTFESLFRYGGDLGQLVNRNGIVISNKSHMQQFSDSFSFASRLAYKLTPGCTRVITYGSHSIDFARAPVVDHNVKTLLFQASLMEENRFLLLQDFKSDDMTTTSVADLSSQSAQTTDTWGIIQILEILHVTSQLKGPIRESLTEHGFEVLSTTELASSLLMTMKEGYIMARQEGPYTGLDVHLSSALPKMSPLVNTLVQKLGPVISSYRLVTNGSEPGARRDGTSTKSTSRALPRNDAILGDILSEIKTFMLSSPRNGLVICETIQDCPSSDRLKELGMMETVRAVEVCPNIDENTSENVLIETMVACETRLQEWIHHVFIENEVHVDAIILDGGLTYRSLQLVDAVINGDEKNWDSWISEDSILVTLPSQNPMMEARRFVTNQFHNVRRILRQDEADDMTGLASKADFIVLSQDGAQHAEFSVVVTQGKKHIRESFQTLEAKISEKLINADLQVRIRELQAGPLEFLPLLPAKRFQHSDYEETNFEMNDSGPKGAQALVQIVAKDGEPLDMDDVIGEVTRALETIDIEVLNAHFMNESTVLDLNRGEIIITIHHNEGMDLHLYLPCRGGDCPMSDFVDFMISFRVHHPEWYMVSLDVLGRGARSTVGFDNYSFVRDSDENSEGDNEDEQDEDDDDNHDDEDEDSD